MTPERLAEIKKICACIPFADADAGLAETEAAMRELIKEIEMNSSEERPKIEMTSVDREVSSILDIYESERGDAGHMAYRQLRAQCVIAQQLARIADTFDNWSRSGVPVEKVP